MPIDPRTTQQVQDWAEFRDMVQDPAIAKPCPFCGIKHKPAGTHPLCDMAGQFNGWVQMGKPRRASAPTPTAPNQRTLPMKPRIRCAVMPNGNIGASYYDGGLLRRVVIEPRLGNVVETHQAEPGSDAFRWLVRTARDAMPRPLPVAPNETRASAPTETPPPGLQGRHARTVILDDVDAPEPANTSSILDRSLEILLRRT